jgi:hypothetical protein
VRITPGLTNPVVVSVNVYSSINIIPDEGNFPVRLALSNVSGSSAPKGMTA